MLCDCVCSSEFVLLTYARIGNLSCLITIKLILNLHWYRMRNVTERTTLCHMQNRLSRVQLAHLRGLTVDNLFIFICSNLYWFFQWAMEALVRLHEQWTGLDLLCSRMWHEPFFHVANHIIMVLRENNSLLKGDNSIKIDLHSFEKGSTLKGNNLLPAGSVSFLLEKTPFQKCPGVQERKQEVAKVVSLIQNGGETTRCIQPY